MSLAMFLSKRAREISQGRMDALRAVRYALKEGKQIGDGIAANVLDAGTHVVKMPVVDPQWQRGQEILKEFKRRGFMDSVLHERGLAPQTHLVETRGNKYLVQNAADEIGRYEPTPIGGRRQFPGGLGGTFHPPYSTEKELTQRVLDAGVTTADVGTNNLGRFGNDWKVLDTGHEKMTRAMSEPERMSALEKFVSYGRRKKPWMNE